MMAKCPSSPSGIELHPYASVAQRVFGPLAEALDERVENRGVGRAESFALTQVPLVPSQAVVELEALEELATEGVGGGDERFGGRRGDPAGQGSAHLGEINLRAMRLEAHALAVRDEAYRGAFVDERSELPQRPAERGARVVGSVPRNRRASRAPAGVLSPPSSRGRRASSSTPEARRLFRRGAAPGGR